MRYVLPVIVLSIGLTLSGVAAFYSVYGLMALFSAAAVAVLILGGVLEVAKLALASVLHSNWNRLTGWMKVLFPAQLLVLILITGIGIFGFLSMAHIEQKAGVEGPRSRIAFIETQVQAQKSKIALLERERETLTNSFSVIATTAKDGLTEAMNRGQKTFARALDATAEATAKARNLSVKDFDRINNEIAATLTLIERLEMDKLPLEKEIRTTESKIGPLKYVAQVIYGADDAETTDRAVRALILLLMFVFDPLAISLVVIGGQMLAHAHRYRRPAAAAKVKVKASSTGTSPAVAKPLPSSNVTSFEDARAAKLTRTGKGGAATLRKPKLAPPPPIRRAA